MIVEWLEINFPTWCSLNIIGKLSPLSGEVIVDGLCGIDQESSEFSLASPTEHGYKFETYELVEPVIVKSELFNLYVFILMYVCIICMYIYVHIGPSKPQHLSVNGGTITETTITLSWKEPRLDVPDPLDVPITGYGVEYSKSGEKFKKLEKSLTHEDLTCEVPGLVAHTKYQFRVAAINAGGYGPFTDVVTQFTSESCGYIRTCLCLFSKVRTVHT